MCKIRNTYKPLFLVLIAGILFLSCQQKDTIRVSYSSNNELPVSAAEVFNIPAAQVAVRDPFVFVDSKTQSYYIHANGGNKIIIYKSKDLKMWRRIAEASFLPEAAFWGTKDFWAPDLFLYNSKYYMFITVSSDTQKRGSTILVSDKPEGPFKPLVNAPVTPKDWMCLDASLYIDKASQPWLIYGRSWQEVTDGEIYAQKLSSDLKSVTEAPVLLFKATAASWVGSLTVNGVRGYVTDSPVIYTLDDGTLAMTWSSFDKGGRYVIGQALSVSSNLSGPWQQISQPLNSDHGGHAMLFRDFENKLKISYHSPNNANWRLKIYDVAIENRNFKIVTP